MKICIPIQAETQKEAVKALKKAAQAADLAELWLDRLREPGLKELLKNKPLPVVCVCKRQADRGAFRGTYQALAAHLLQATIFGADYVDFPMQMPEKLSKKIVQQAHKSACKTIVSYHDFKSAPAYPQLVKLAEKLRKRGADIIKIAIFARTMEDTVNVIALAKYLQGEGVRHILIAMGPEGVLSRILTPTLGGEMMFATLGKTGQTAPGQLTVKELRHAWSLLKTKN